MDPTIIGLTAIAVACLSTFWSLRSYLEIKNDMISKHKRGQDTSDPGSELLKIFDLDTEKLAKGRSAASRLRGMIEASSDERINNLKRSFFGALSDLKRLKEQFQNEEQEGDKIEIEKEIQKTLERLKEIEPHLELTEKLVQKVKSELDSADNIIRFKKDIVDETLKRLGEGSDGQQY